jgi:Icc-related predicted phosphoesterase
MKLLLFSDLHADVRAAHAVVQQARDVDVVVGAGDFGNVRRHLSDCIEVLRTIEKPAVLVAGNNESSEELSAACRSWRSAQVLHGNGVSIGGVTFFGLGGGVPVTPFGSWSYDFSEAQASALLATCPARCVLVSHSPPKGVVDIASNGRSLGSVAVRDTIVNIQPRLVVCGHIHASAGQRAVVGDTVVINAGPRGVLWELEAST